MVYLKCSGVHAVIKKKGGGGAPAFSCDIINFSDWGKLKLCVSAYRRLLFWLLLNLGVLYLLLLLILNLLMRQFEGF